MNFQSLDPELTAKVLLLANLQRNLIQNQIVVNEKTTEREQIQTNAIRQQPQQIMHPLLIPSLGVSSQKISAMLTALTPSARTSTLTATTNGLTMHPSVAQMPVNNNNASNIRTAPHLRSNGSSFGWGNRERKMEENWRLQNRSV